MRFRNSAPKVSQKSFTFIDVLVGIFLILVVFLGIFGAFNLGIKTTNISRNKISATAIANGEIEKIRNLPYELVGVEGSFPDGVLEPTFKIIRNNIEYTIENRADYVVDETDGVAPPSDDCPNDYKKAEVKVSWAGPSPGELKISTDIAPENLAQECAEIGGILSVSVFDAFGVMIPSPLIEVKNPETNESIKTATPIGGKHYFSLLPSTYKMVISKIDYSAEQSYGSGEIYQGVTIANPEKPHPIVLEGDITEVSFSIDRLSSMTIEARGTQEAEYPVVHNVTFVLTGEQKKIGTDSGEATIYKYSQSHTTNGSGVIDIPNLDWDSYNFLVDPVSGLDLIEIESPPGTETTQPIGLAPDTNLQVRLILKAENTLLVTVQDITTGEPIFSASVRLYNADYDITQSTDTNGKTYFIPLEPAIYNLDIDAPGYSSTSATVNVSGDTTKIIELEQIE